MGQSSGLVGGSIVWSCGWINRQVLRVNRPLIYLVLWLGQFADLCGLVGQSTDISIWSCESIRGYQYLVLLVNPLVCLVLWVNPLICLVLSGPVGQSAD